jgi:muconolactone delta-isomerase
MYTIPYNFWRRPICFSQFTMFHIDNIIKLQRLYSQISRLNWSELDENTIRKAVSGADLGFVVRGGGE